MMLRELVNDTPIKKIQGTLDVSITGITQDSRQVKQGFLFVAIRGHQEDGHRFISDAVKKGASAVMIADEPDSSLSLTQLVVEDSRKALAQVAARYYGEPSLKMRVIGVTGTNGKTTVTYLLESILSEAGRRPAVVGTINYRFGKKTFPADNTTPESVDLQRLFAEFHQAGATDVIMEVSSHALAQGRVEGIHFDAGVFTNLTQDHLDFHSDIEDYFQAKLRLFCEFLPQSKKKETFAVVNMEDPRGEEILIMTKGVVRSVRAAPTGPYEVACRSYQLGEEGITADVQLGASRIEIKSTLIGQFNLENILLAAGVAHSLGIAEEAISKGIAKLSSVPGRMEKIANDRGILVFVDYAHTPDALGRVGENLKRFVHGRQNKMMTVFGCGGDRDRSKRPLMGREVAAFSDLVILTSDNPRTEDPEEILDQIMAGLKEAGFPPDRIQRIVSREEALAKAVGLARPGDLVLVAGKGHEDYQILGKKKIHFSDQEILRKLLGR